MTFHVGQKVVCVNDDDPGHIYDDCPSSPSPFSLGDVVTVAESDPNWLGRGLAFVRIVEDMPPTGWYWAENFRPVQEKGMSILRSIAANPKRELEGV